MLNRLIAESLNRKIIRFARYFRSLLARENENVSKDKHIFYKNNHFVNNYLFFHPMFYYQSTTKLSHYIKISTFSSYNYKKSSISLAKRARNVQKTPFYFSALSIILFTFVGYFT
jgi:hypothetical protein